MTSTNMIHHAPALASPGEKSYAAAIATFNTDAHLHPDVAVIVTAPSEVGAAVLEARALGLGVRTQTTGHAAKTSSAMNGDALIRTRIAGSVIIDPIRRTARVPAGTLWAEVVEAAAPYGLVAIHGSSPTVGVIGFLLRGGLSFYGRQYAVSANSLLSIDITSADGVSTTASAAEQTDLFWALRGGGGGFGVVTAVEIQLYELTQIITGAAFWPATEAARIAPLWLEWTRTAPTEATTNLRVINLPPLPGIPPMLTAGPVLVLDGAIAVRDPSRPDESQRMWDDLLVPMLAAAVPLLNTWARALPATLPHTHMDPPEPLPGIGDHMLLNDLDADALLHILALAGSDATLAVFELRQLGGRFADPVHPGGAFDRIAAKFLYLGAGAVFDEVARSGIDARLVIFREYLEPWRSDFTAPTFVENHSDPQRTIDDAGLARVARVRAQFDPTGVFAGDVSPVKDVPAP
jgi:hypothetical protein